MWLMFVLENSPLLISSLITQQYSMGFAGWEVEGFVLEAKGRNQCIEECDTIPWCYEFSASWAFG